MSCSRRARSAAGGSRRGGTLGFLPETREVREGDWQVAPPPRDLRRRRVEITGPVDRKTVVNALGSRADGFMTELLP